MRSEGGIANAAGAGARSSSSVLLAVAMLAIGLDVGVARVTYGVALPAFARDLQLSLTAAGLLGTLHLIGYPRVPGHEVIGKIEATRGILPMIESVPLANSAEAYGRMMRNEARFRIVLVTVRFSTKSKANSAPILVGISWPFHLKFSFILMWAASQQLDAVLNERWAVNL